MGGPTHKWVGPPIVTHGTNKGGLLQGGGNGRTMHTNPLSRGEPIGWGAIKTHCTAMDPVAANRRLNASGFVKFLHQALGTRRPAQRSPVPFGPGAPKDFEKSSKRVRKGCPGAFGPGEPQSPQRVHPGVRKESKNGASDSFGPEGPGRPLCQAGGFLNQAIAFAIASEFCR